MKLRIKYNHWYLKYIASGYAGMVIYPWILFKYPKDKVTDYLFRHEMQHVYQIERTGWIKYYAKWLWYTMTKGYINNPYEIEARERRNDHFTIEECKLKDES